MTITALNVFEEIRFSIELFIGTMLFLQPYAKKKKHIYPKLLTGFLLITLIVMLRFPIIAMEWNISSGNRQFLIAGLYVSSMLLLMLVSWLSFEITVSDAIFFGTAGYAAQHLVYVLIHEVIAQKLFLSVRDHLILYILLSLVGCLIVYVPVYFAFAKNLKEFKGNLFEDKLNAIIENGILCVVLLYLCFLCQNLFESGEPLWWKGATLGAMSSVLILSIFHQTLETKRAYKDQMILEQMLRDGEKNYHHSRELIEYVNRTVHDLKHTLKALELSDSAERNYFTNDTWAAIEEYQQIVFSENEVLNTILSEKAMLCKHKGVDFSVSLGQVDISSISVPDIYVILGNAIDNAIEGAVKVSDVEKRVVSISIKQIGGTLFIQTNNYFEGELQMESGLPTTRKGNSLEHGYGLKSIRLLAEKYGGSISISKEDQVFILVILLTVF